jgi:hypothetical protein
LHCCGNYCDDYFLIATITTAPVAALAAISAVITAAAVALTKFVFRDVRAYYYTFNFMSRTNNNLVEFILKNAEYTVDEKDQLLVTIRFCDKNVKAEKEPINVEQFHDNFYDKIAQEDPENVENQYNMSNGRLGCYIRERNGKTVMKQKSWQSADDHGDRAHYYLQTPLHCLPNDYLSSILSYSFVRYTYFENDTVSLYKDVITDPVPYSVTTLTLRFIKSLESSLLPIQMQKCLELEFVSSYLENVEFLTKHSGLPVTFSKFMYLLQLSRFHKYYCAVFVRFDRTSSSRSVRNNVEVIYHDDQSTVDAYQEYIWVTASLSYFHSLLEYRNYTVERAHRTLKEEYEAMLTSEESPFDSKQDVDVC